MLRMNFDLSLEAELNVHAVGLYVNQLVEQGKIDELAAMLLSTYEASMRRDAAYKRIINAALANGSLSI